MKKILFFLFNSLKKIPFFAYIVLFAATATLIITSVKFDLLETYLFDLNTRTASTLKLFNLKNPKIEIIQISPETLKVYGGYPKADIHTALLNKLKNVKNSVIVYNLRKVNNQLSGVDGSYEQKLEFANLAINMKNVFFIFNDMDIAGNGPLLNSKLNTPLDKLSLYSAPRTIDAKINSKGSVTRRIILNYQDQLLSPMFFAKKINSTISTAQDIWGSFERIGTFQAYIRFQPNGSFPTHNLENFIQKNIDLSTLENKIILVGDNSDTSIEDYTDSPFASDAPDLISTTELYANMFQTLIDNTAPKKIPFSINFIITLFISILTVYVAFSVKPSKGILLILSTLLLYWLLSILLLAFFNLWIDMAHPFLAIFLCYYFFIPYRLIIENRRSWEYLQKNKLLQQVEELKTNFISMMSHDLKTPLARIQGMTEIILKDAVALSSTQREAVDTIKGSSNELLKFINSILQYGRIESQGIELHKQSKDINQLLMDVIKKHEFLAKIKKIRIITEFETLFPILVDADLMRQVFSNLIENAIKYSAEEASVTIKSREVGDRVIIEVIDNGIGIPDEDLPNIFMKFYRSQNVKTSTIKGTGLGLYLAQYFVQLHKGEISVTSQARVGTTFTVSLPLNS